MMPAMDRFTLVPDDADVQGPLLRFAVRDMAAFALRNGDLFQHWFRTPTGRQGIQGHQRLQRRRGKGYQAEVPVRCRVTCDSYTCEIRGRIDGVQRDGDQVVVEEIKTTLLDFDRLPTNAIAVHLGQAKLYAWMVAEEHGLAQVTARLTYFHIETEKTHEISEVLDRAALETFFFDVLERCYAWQVRLLAWRTTRDAALESLTFPHAFREGQRRLAGEVFRAVRDGAVLLAEAPTGIGKSLGVVFPALKAMGAHGLDHLFFLTAKGTGQAAALHAVRQLQQVGLRLKSLVVNARDKTCFESEGSCDVARCPYALGYYDRFRSAMDALFERDAIDRDTLAEVARAFQVCPFELCMDMTPYVDLMIADYNYAFDPGAHLRRFFGEEKGETALLVDEAHNLVDRARSMFSATFEKRDVLAAKRALQSLAPNVARALAGLNRRLKAVHGELETAGEEQRVVQHCDAKIVSAVEKVGTALAVWKSEPAQSLFNEPLPEVLRELARFRRLCDFFQEEFVWVWQRFGRNLKVQILCLNPGPMLRRRLEMARAATFFSATLAPFDYHQKLFGLDETARRLRLPSPFAAAQQYTVIADHISTRYRDRAHSLEALTALIATVVGAKRGNYLVFFPSYQYLQQVLAPFQALAGEVDCVVQERAMDEQARLQFLAAFSVDRPRTLVGFAVMGGVFGEGVDLVGERLIGVVVVGVGLPKICLERDLIRDHFGGDGFHTAYRVPGFHKVLQTAGRVIRDEGDRGVVCLVDSRFTAPDYLAMVPSFWSLYRVNHTRALEEGLREFWNRATLDGTYPNQ